MSTDFRRRSILLTLTCALMVCAFAAWSGPGAENNPPSPYDDAEYKEIIAQQVGNIYDLEALAAAVQDDFLPILPPVPELILRQSGGPEVLPFDAKFFPPAFVSGMAGIYENSVPVYPILVVEDPTTRALTFYNLDNQPLYTLPPPAGYDPFAFLRSRWPSLFNGGANEAARRNMMQMYDPARIQVRAKLIAADQLALWIYTKRQIEAAQALQSGGGTVELKMMLGDAPNSNIFFTVVKRATNYVSMTIQYPSGFTNGLDVFTCNDLMAEIWIIGVKNLATTGTNVTWLDTNTWVASGMPMRLYAAGDATMDGDGDGYADAREILVYGTDPMSATSHPVTVSGTVSYSGIETGGVYMLFTQAADNWSIAKSIRQASPAAYTNEEIGNNQDYWFKAFRDANGNFALDAWEPRGIYSSSSTYVTGNLAGVDVAMADVPSIWGQISYSGTATGDIHIVAVTGSNSWDTTYSTTIPYIQGDDGSGGVFYVTFPINYVLTGIPASNYWIRAFMDTDTNGTVSLFDPAGQYASNAIPVSNRVTGIDFTLVDDGDGDGLPDGWEYENFGDTRFDEDADPDGDELNNEGELEYLTDPGNNDTDGDGLWDGEEARLLLAPKDPADANPRRPASFHITSNCGDIWFVNTKVGTNHLWGHLLNMEVTTESEAATGTLRGAMCENVYGSTGDGHGDPTDTYTTFYRHSATTLVIKIDCYSNMPPGANRTYGGNLRLYRASIDSWAPIFHSERTTNYQVDTYGYTNRLYWSTYLAAPGQILLLQVNYHVTDPHPFTVNIRAGDGISDPPSILPVNSTAQLQAIISPPMAGAYSWTASGGRLTLLNNTSATVTVVAGSNASSSVGAESIRCDFTPAGENLTCGTNITMTVLKVEKVFVSFGDAANALPGYDHEAPVTDYLTGIGATYDQANSVWTYDDIPNCKRFEVRIVGEAGFVQALQTPDAYVGFRGHSNYGIGLAWNNACESISAFLNVGTPNAGASWSGILEQQASLVIDNTDLASNPTNSSTALGYERFANSAGTFGGQNVPDVGTTAPNNVFTSIYGTGTNRFHYYALSSNQNPRIILKVRYPDCDDVPTLRYKWLFLDSCYSGLYYADTFTHGIFFYTTTLEYLSSDSLKRFVQAIVESKTPGQLEASLDVMDDELGHPTQVNYEYHSY